MAKGIPTKKDYVDGDLFLKIQQGDKDAWAELYECSHRSLYAYLLSMTRNEADAKDLLQDTYIQIYKNCHLYQEKGNPLAWMMKIARNLFLMRYRQESRRQIVPYEDACDQLGTDQITELENKLLIETMFRSLSEEERNIIIMHHVAGLKFREISAILEKPLGTILTRYNRSIRKLRKIPLE